MRDQPRNYPSRLRQYDEQYSDGIWNGKLNLALCGMVMSDIQYALFTVRWQVWQPKKPLWLSCIKLNKCLSMWTWCNLHLILVCVEAWSSGCRSGLWMGSWGSACWWFKTNWSLQCRVAFHERKPDSAVNEPLNPDTFVMSVQNMLWLPMRDVWVPSAAEIKSTARPGVIFLIT